MKPDHCQSYVLTGTPNTQTPQIIREMASKPMPQVVADHIHSLACHYETRHHFRYKLQARPPNPLACFSPRLHAQLVARFPRLRNNTTLACAVDTHAHTPSAQSILRLGPSRANHRRGQVLQHVFDGVGRQQALQAQRGLCLVHADEHKRGQALDLRDASKRSAQGRPASARTKVPCTRQAKAARLAGRLGEKWHSWHACKSHRLLLSATVHSVFAAYMRSEPARVQHSLSCSLRLYMTVHVTREH
jgi:hypothetical protein